MTSHTGFLPRNGEIGKSHKDREEADISTLSHMTIANRIIGA